MQHGNPPQEWEECEESDEAPENGVARRSRRSKNDTTQRNYKCNYCEKSYLSYPALYTHMKQKHASDGQRPPLNGRGRGRPRKTVSLII